MRNLRVMYSRESFLYDCIGCSNVSFDIRKLPKKILCNQTISRIVKSNKSLFNKKKSRITTIIYKSIPIRYA